MSGKDYTLQKLEDLFDQDLNNDGTIGLFTSQIEADGLTSLIAKANRYFFEDDGPSLKYLGADVVAGQFGAVAPIAVEASAGGGYDVVWKVSGADQYTAWHTDGNGNYASSLTGTVSGSSAEMKVLETLFDHDLNGDGTTGIALTVIEADGSTDLSTGAGRYFLENVGTPDATLKYLGKDVVAGQFGAVAPIAVEASAGGGYDVVWKVNGADQYVAWHTDGNGNYASSLTGTVSGSSADLKVLETLFGHDLNGDGTTGIPLTVIETNGSTGLSTGADRYFFENVGTPDSTLKYLGKDVVAGQFGAAAPIGAEAAAGGGYDVVWKVNGADQYVAWHTDGNGNYASSLTGVVSGNDPALRALETAFDQDLNGNGFIG